MPARDTAGRPRAGRLPAVLFWAGAGLAPVAALLLLFSDGNGGLRTAAVLALSVVVLIGLSVYLRNGADVVADVEATLDEELEELRTALRREFALALHNGQDVLGERLRVLQDAVESLRAQVDAAQANAVAAGRLLTGAASGQSGPPAEVAVDEASHANWPGAFDSGRIRSGPDGYAADRRYGATAPVPRPGPPVEPGHGPGAAGTARVTGSARLPRGVVRHTETVRVTTRQTVVGPQP
ncbi:MAG TPA: hypothetical protein VGD43_15535, partial [Micromonospora sp.]